MRERERSPRSRGLRTLRSDACGVQVAALLIQGALDLAATISADRWTPRLHPRPNRLGVGVPGVVECAREEMAMGFRSFEPSHFMLFFR